MRRTTCPHCGNIITREASECPLCGASLNRARVSDDQLQRIRRGINLSLAALVVGLPFLGVALGTWRRGYLWIGLLAVVGAVSLGYHLRRLWIYKQTSRDRTRPS